MMTILFQSMSQCRLNLLAITLLLFASWHGAVQAQSYMLNVIGSTASGNVISSIPSGIDCGMTCSVSYTQITSVELTAKTASGYTFVGWSGACSGTDNETTVVVSKPVVNCYGMFTRFVSPTTPQVVQIALGLFTYSCVLLQDGTVRCWGEWE